MVKWLNNGVKWLRKRNLRRQENFQESKIGSTPISMTLRKPT